MTDTNKTPQDYDNLKQTFKEKAWPITEEKKKRSAALKIAFSDKPKKLEAELKEMYKDINTPRLEENADLIKSYREAAKEKRTKKENEVFEEIFEKVKKEINPKIDRQQLKETIIPKKSESKEKQFLALKEDIINKPNATTRHKEWLKDKVDKLMKLEDLEWLQQLNTNINFTDNHWLAITTPQGVLKFKPNQATYDDVKDIDGIKNNKNIWTENTASKKKWLRANFDAVQKMRTNGKKKICDKDQFLAAANAFPWGDILGESNRSTKTKDFFDLLWVDQYGLRGPDGTWYGDSRCLWSASASWDDAFYMGCYDSEGTLDRGTQDCGFGVWFLEDED